MAIVSKGQYSTTAPTLSTDGEYECLQVDSSGNLFVHSTASGVLALPDPLAGATSTTGKIGTVANTAALYIVCDCSSVPVSYIDWVIASDQQFNYQFYRALEHPLSFTLTLADATVVDDGDTFVLNGLTFTAEATEDDADDETRLYWTGANNAAAAVNLTALLNDADYGVPGFTFAVAAVSATDVITATPTTATTVQFGQGTSAADEIAFTDATLANLYYQAAKVEDVAANSATMAGASYKQTLDGWPYGVLYLQNDSGSAAATFVVSALKY
jgi:hypothetical protein